MNRDIEKKIIQMYEADTKMLEDMQFKVSVGLWVCITAVVCILLGVFVFRPGTESDSLRHFSREGSVTIFRMLDLISAVCILGASLLVSGMITVGVEPITIRVALKLIKSRFSYKAVDPKTFFTYEIGENRYYLHKITEDEFKEQQHTSQCGCFSNSWEEGTDSYEEYVLCIGGHYRIQLSLDSYRELVSLYSMMEDKRRPTYLILDQDEYDKITREGQLGLDTQFFAKRLVTVTSRA